MSSIDRSSPIPLYYQLQKLLVDHINSGKWQAGDMLPTEEQLMEQYGLSRTTVRQSLKEMELDGLISRFRGRGTFVSRPKLSHSPEPHYSLTDVLLKQGAKPGWKVISAGWSPAPAEVVQRLALVGDTTAYCLQRVRLADDELIGYHVAYLAPAWADAVDETALARGGSLHYLSGKDYLEGSYANRIIEAIAAPGSIARRLEVERGSPLLLIRRLVYSREGKPIEDLQAMYRGDRFQYHIRHLPDGHNR